MRRFWMVILGAGAILGIASGIHSARWHGGFCDGSCQGPGARRVAFEDHVADVCTRAAERVYHKQDGATPPRPAP